MLQKLTKTLVMHSLPNTPANKNQSRSSENNIFLITFDRTGTDFMCLTLILMTRPLTQTNVILILWTWTQEILKMTCLILNVNSFIQIPKYV